MKKIIKFIVKNWKKLIIIFILLVGVIIFFSSKNKKADIKTSEIKKGNIKEELVLSGYVTATNYAKLSFETSGKIVYVGVKEGDTVYKGKLISKLDTTVLNSYYQIALSNLRIGDATVENIHDQLKDHSTDENYAQKDLRTTAEANKDKAYEAVIAAKRNLDGASLYAPFNGIVTYLNHPFTGVYTSLTAVEAEIIDPTTMYFEVLADQTEVTKLTEGQSVTIVLDSYEDKNFEGKLENISFIPKIGESGSVYKVKVSFVGVDFENSKFKMSMTGDAKFITQEKENVLYVPFNFLKQDKVGEYLKINAKNKRIYVESGLESEDSVEVIGDISEGLKVYD